MKKQQQKLDVHNWCLIKLREVGLGYSIYLYFQTAYDDQNILLIIHDRQLSRILVIKFLLYYQGFFFCQQNPPRFLSKV